MVRVKNFRLKGFFKKKNSQQMWKKNHTSLYKEVAGTFSLQWEKEVMWTEETIWISDQKLPNVSD